MTRFRRITRTSLFARMSLLFGLLVTMPLVISGIVLSLAGWKVVNQSGENVAQIGTRAVDRQSQIFNRVARERLELASQRIADLGGQRVKETSVRAIEAGKARFQETTTRMRDRGQAAVREATDEMVRLGERKLADSSGKLRQLNVQSQEELQRRFVEGMRAELASSRHLQESLANLEKSITAAWSVGADRRAASVYDRSQREIAEILLRLNYPLKMLYFQLLADPDKVPRTLETLGRNKSSIIRAALVSPTGNEIARVPAAEAAGADPVDWTLPNTPENRTREALFAKETARVLEAVRQDERTKKWIIRISHKVLPSETSESPTVVAGEGAMAMVMENRQPTPFVVVDYALDSLVSDAVFDLPPDDSKQIFVVHAGTSVIISSRKPEDVGNISNRALERLPKTDEEASRYRRESFAFSYVRQDGVVMRARARYWEDDHKCWTVVAEPDEVVLAPVRELARNIRDASEASLSSVEAAGKQFVRDKSKEAQSIVDSRLATARKQMRWEEHLLKNRVRKDLEGYQASLVGALAKDLDRKAQDLRETAVRGIDTEARAQARDANHHVLVEASIATREATADIQRSSRSVANRAARQMLGNSTWLIPLFLLLALFLATLTAKSLVRPINLLVKGTQALAAGDYSQRIRIQGDDELSRLAVAFNDMAGAIEHGQAELQQSHDSLAAEKARIQGILDSSPDGLVMLEPSGQVAFINPTAIQLLSLRPRQVPAAPFEIDELPEAAAARLRECLAQAESAAGVQEVEFGDQERRVLQLREVQLRSGRGRSHGRLLHLHDITRERVIDEMKSDFISLVSHELRTPLTSILGFSSYMLTGRMGAVAETQRTALESIHRQAKRLSAIISDFLDVSRIESGKIEMKKEPVALASVADRVVQDLRPQANEKHVQVSTGVEDGSLPVVALGDEQRIAQVFINLVGNALKFTEPQGTIDVRLARRNGEVVCRVRDSGCGIPPDELDRVFDRFYQVEKVVTRKSGGTGLGLAIVKNIVEAHGGRIWIESELGRGTEVSFTLPSTD